MLLLCVVTTSAHISKPDQHVAVLQNRRARRSKDVAQSSESPSWRTFARMCRRMPGGCGGKMARQARQRLRAMQGHQRATGNKHGTRKTRATPPGCVKVLTVDLHGLLPEPIFPGLIAAYRGLMRQPMPRGMAADWMPGHWIYQTDWGKLECSTNERREPSLYWLPVSPGDLLLAAEQQAYKFNTSAAAALRHSLGLGRIPNVRRLSTMLKPPLWMQRLPVSIVMHWLTEQSEWQDPVKQRRHAIFVPNGPDAFITPGSYPRPLGSSGKPVTHLTWKSGPGFLTPFDTLSQRVLRSAMLLLTIEDRHWRNVSTRLRLVTLPVFLDPAEWIPVALHDHFINGARLFSSRGPAASLSDFLAAKDIPLAYSGSSTMNCNLGWVFCASPRLTKEKINQWDWKKPALWNSTRVRMAISRAQAISIPPFTWNSSGGIATVVHGENQDQTLRMAQLYSRAQFCVCPAGDSFQTKRLYSAVFSLCIPILVSDYFPLPFDDDVKWGSFMLRLSAPKVIADAAAALTAAIDSVRSVPGKLQRMQHAMARAVPHLLFTKTVTSNALDAAGLRMLYKLIARSEVRDQSLTANFTAPNPSPDDALRYAHEIVVQ